MQVLDGFTVDVGYPRAAAEVVGMIKISKQFHNLMTIGLAKIEK